MDWNAILLSGDGRILVILFFMAVISTSIFLKVLAMLFRPSKYNSSDNKILGGLAVLIVAIIAHNGWIYFLSFFIAGLLIASERFMLLLAAVFNSDRTNVHKIPSYWHEDQKLYDEQDLVDTFEESAEENITIEPSRDKKQSKDKDVKPQETKEEKKERFKKYVEKISDIEARVLRILKARSDFRFLVKNNVTVKVGEKTVQYDAIYVEQETNRIQGAFEIKYFPIMRAMNVKAYLGNRAKKYIADEFKVGFIIVFNTYDHDELDKILETVEEFENTHQNAFVTIYQNEPQSLTTLYETSLKRAFPTAIEEIEKLGF